MVRVKPLLQVSDYVGTGKSLAVGEYLWLRRGRVLMVIRDVTSSSEITYGDTSCDLVAGEWVVVELYEPNWLVTFLGVFSVN